MRPETGPLRFKGDWTGIYVRGDQALFYATVLSNPNTMAAARDGVIQGLSDLFYSVDEHDQPNPEHPVQELKPFEECKNNDTIDNPTNS